MEGLAPSGKVSVAAGGELLGAGWPESHRARVSEEREARADIGSRQQWNLLSALGEQSDS